MVRLKHHSDIAREKDLHQCEESLEYVAEYPTSEINDFTDEQSRL